MDHSTSPQPHTGVLLVNLGTPDSPSVGDVRRYLREFLMDGRVIDIPFLSRFFLVNCIIAPFRAPKSAKVYQEVWTDAGSPLKVYSEELKRLLQTALGDGYRVSLGMRYQNPSLEKALEELHDQGFRRLIIVPLFPQYASATTGSVKEKVMALISQWQLIPELTFVDQFYEHPLFVEAFTALGKRYLEAEPFDHVLFSYHGLPERQIRKGDPHNHCLRDGCCDSVGPHNRLCYRAQCFQTSRLLAQALGLSDDQWTVCFQSRLGRDPWIQPYTEDVVKQLVAQGKKRVLAYSPAFVADCLETTIEIGEEYKEVFMETGGERWQLVESLNVDPRWVATLQTMIQERSRAEHVSDEVPHTASLS
ncbi:ferrochelatase [Catalinimonas alkaloidigena]|uniref:Ferrochelatase n=1 Tax=Catalinimonas alkaloidigena TaxID=1075417 RepID=A0A1G9ASG4_9BACT|nr:ferrochelatase [Catalinimonas alkaloidigena]SDK29570.1 ferrochelatase [Catalinimonas alkaloidigena]